MGQLLKSVSAPHHPSVFGFGMVGLELWGHFCLPAGSLLGSANEGPWGEAARRRGLSLTFQSGGQLRDSWAFFCKKDLSPFPYLFIQLFLYINVDSCIFILHFGLWSILHYLFCCSNYSSFGHWKLFWLVPVAL